MKLCLILMTVTVLQLQAAVGYSQNRFSIDNRQIELKKLLEWIETQSSYRFLYNIKSFPAKEKVDVKFENATLPAMLDRILQGRSSATASWKTASWSFLPGRKRRSPSAERSFPPNKPN